MLTAFLFAAALAADPTPPAAPATPPTSPAATHVLVDSPYKNPAIQEKKAADTKVMVCRAEEQTGSRLGAMRVCMTKAEWDARSARDRQVLDDAQQRGFTAH